MKRRFVENEAQEEEDDETTAAPPVRRGFHADEKDTEQEDVEQRQVIPDNFLCVTKNIPHFVKIFTAVHAINPNHLRLTFAADGLHIYANSGTHSLILCFLSKQFFLTYNVEREFDLWTNIKKLMTIKELKEITEMTIMKRLNGTTESIAFLGTDVRRVTNSIYVNQETPGPVAPDLTFHANCTFVFASSVFKSFGTLVKSPHIWVSHHEDGILFESLDAVGYVESSSKCEVTTKTNAPHIDNYCLFTACIQAIMAVSDLSADIRLSYSEKYPNSVHLEARLDEEKVRSYFVIFGGIRVETNDSTKPE